MEILEIPDMRVLEDFLIADCFYPQVIKGKLDQKSRVLHITSSINRDIKKEEISNLTKNLSEW